MTGCSIVEEQPAGAGFGAAVLQLADSFRIGARDADGDLTEGRSVRIATRYQGP